MSKVSFSWLHLTDFHYGLKGQDCLWPTLREPFLDSLAPLHERCGPWDAVLFTGDLVQSGESAQFKEMQAEVLDPLWEKLKELGSGDAVLLAVPGNHDLYRPDSHEDNPAIDALLDKDGFRRIETKFWDQPTGSYRRVVTDAFAAYSQWWEEALRTPRGVKSGILPGDFSVTIESRGRRIGIVGLNTTFFQLAGGDYEGKLVWDARQLHAVCEGGVDVWTKQHDVCLLLTHQGPNWLTPDAQDQGTEIAPPGRFAVHLFGHQHETDITYISRGGSQHSVRRCQGCSVFGMEKFGEPPTVQRAHGYAAGRIEFGDAGGVLRLWPRIATSKTKRWRFIPDHGHAELTDDEGTAPEPVATRPGPAAGTAGAAKSGAAPGTAAAPSASGPHSTLPARRPFFGRQKDLERIAKYLRPEDRSWGVVLDGPGGVGKTSLALEAAHRAPAEHFPLKLWITAKNRELLPHGEHRLTDHHVDDFHAMLSELGRALGRDDIPKAVPEERPNLVRHALASYRALLVLDNLETFSAEDRRRVFELLGNLPSTCRAIVTSRRRTDGSTAGHNLRVDRLERDAADELLAELGRRWEPVALLTQAERDQLYNETGGNPLLLTWTAGQLGRITGRCRTVAEAVARLQEAHRLQKIDEKNDPLDFIFGDLVETFTADEMAVLAALVHFTQPAPVEWLLPLTGLSSKAAEMALDGLRDRALLVEDNQSAKWLLPPLAARFLRRTHPKAVGVSGKRLADQVYALVMENGYEQFPLFPNLEAAWPKIAAALPVLLAGNNRRLQAFCDAVKYFVEFSGRWDEMLSLNKEAERRAKRAKDFRSAGWRANDACHCHYLRGQSAGVLLYAGRAAAYWQKAEAGPHERAIAILLRGRSHVLAKDYEAAVFAFREALEIERSLSSESVDLASTLNDLADALRFSGVLKEAEVIYKEALVIAKDRRNQHVISNVTGSLAELAMACQQWRKAERLSRRALRISERVGRKDHIAFHSECLAFSLAMQGRGGEGLSHAQRAVAMLTELRSPILASAQATLKVCME